MQCVPKPIQQGFFRYSLKVECMETCCLHMLKENGIHPFLHMFLTVENTSYMYWNDIGIRGVGNIAQESLTLNRVLIV